MKRIGIALAISAAVLACTGKPKEEPPREEPNPRPGFSDDGAAAQQRIGQYLLASVVDSDMRTCWAALKGAGVVAADLTYRKNGGNWTFNTAAIKRTSLTDNQDAIAQRCLEAAASGTSFTVDEKEDLENRAEQFIVRMGWPVPMPPEGAEVSDSAMARMINTGGGGAGITISGCSTCELRGVPPYGYKCVSKSSGSETDCDEISTNVCATTPKACLRAGFGGARGIVMF
jgi:hypothetical protein